MQVTFTDEDLKRLKEFGAMEFLLETEYSEIHHLLPKLLARLEAAENLVAWEWDNGDYQALLKAWLRSKGSK